MKAAIRSILKGVEKVTDICSDILTYEIRNGYSIRGDFTHKRNCIVFIINIYLHSVDNHRNIKGWCRDLRRFTKKIKAANRKYLEEVLKLKENLHDSVMQEEVYVFFLDVTQSLILYVKKLTKSIRPFIIR